MPTPSSSTLPRLSAKLTTDKDGKVVAPEGMQQALEKYLQLQPNGTVCRSCQRHAADDRRDHSDELQQSEREETGEEELVRRRVYPAHFSS